MNIIYIIVVFSKSTDYWDINYYLYRKQRKLEYCISNYLTLICIPVSNENDTKIKTSSTLHISSSSIWTHVHTYCAITTEVNVNYFLLLIMVLKAFITHFSGQCYFSVYLEFHHFTWWCRITYSYARMCFILFCLHEILLMSVNVLFNYATLVFSLERMLDCEL